MIFQQVPMQGQPLQQVPAVGGAPVAPLQAAPMQAAPMAMPGVGFGGGFDFSQQQQQMPAMSYVQTPYGMQPVLQTPRGQKRKGNNNNNNGGNGGNRALEN